MKITITLRDQHGLIKHTETFDNPVHKHRYAAAHIAMVMMQIGDTLTVKEEKERWVCPVDDPLCDKPCGNYGCGQ